MANYYEVKVDDDVINDPDYGLFAISLVDIPANNYDFIAMSKYKQVGLSAIDEERRVLIGPLLVPDQEVERTFGYMIFRKEAIESLHDKFCRDMNYKKIRLDHKGGSLDDIIVQNIWIKQDEVYDISAKYPEYADLPVGTLLCQMKVYSDDLWNDYIKTGKVKGFSIDAFLDFEKIEMSLQKIEKNDLQEQTNIKNKKEIMNKKASFWSKIKTLMAEEGIEEVDYLSIEVEEVGTLYAEDFSLDYVVFQEVDGVKVPFADKSFTYEEKEFKTDVDGKIVEINDVETLEDVATEMKKMIAKYETLMSKKKVQMSEMLWEYEAEDGTKYYAEYLSIGQVVQNESQELVASASFTVQGLIYSTNELGEIVEMGKDANSPFWSKEDAVVSEEEVAVEETTEMRKQKLQKAALLKARQIKMEEEELLAEATTELEDVVEEVETVEQLKAKIAELEELVKSLQVIEEEIEVVKAENVELRKLPGARKLSETVSMSKVDTSKLTKTQKRASFLKSLK